ncbi:hypothetical protein [Komagataeibacter europaeus]|uniref:hypothetical protein n=1 Tax=Komagataeibacter europaeus TaxID=33995 RepID=UPI001F2766B5|nr:hypothetical protein [Komagataeibacter europaeus]
MISLTPYRGADMDDVTLSQLQAARSHVATSTQPPFPRATLIERSAKRLLEQLGQWRHAPGHAFDILCYLDRARDLGQRGIRLLSAEQADTLIEARWYLDIPDRMASDYFIRALSLVTPARFIQILHEIVELICNATPDIQWLRRGYTLLQDLEKQDAHRDTMPRIREIFAPLPPLSPVVHAPEPVPMRKRRRRSAYLPNLNDPDWDTP